MVAVRFTNPFRYGDLALDEAFTDREAEIAELTSDITNGQNVVIFAPRRYGKSSLMWRVAQECVARGDVLIAQVNLMQTPTKEQLAERLAASIYENIASRLVRARERLRIFRGLRLTPTITIDPHDGSPTFGFEAASRSASCSFVGVCIRFTCAISTSPRATSSCATRHMSEDFP